MHRSNRFHSNYLVGAEWVINDEIERLVSGQALGCGTKIV